MKEFQAKKKIIDIFSGSGEAFVSGEDLSAKMGFSRACVWKYINGLRSEGYDIEAVPNRGYKLVSSPDRLYGYEIEPSLLKGGSIHYYEDITSTNDRAFALAEEGAAEGTIVLAETQSKGKGRLGRKWSSPKYKGIYSSLILRPNFGADQVSTVPLVSGLAIVKAVKGVCGISSRIKWPNDILVDDKKVCGILAEMKAEPDRVDFLVVGIGVNVNSGLKQLPEGAASLASKMGEKVDRKRLLNSILENFYKLYYQLSEEGFSSLRDECKKVSTLIDKKVKVEQHNKTLQGVAVDIDEKGALILEVEGSRKEKVFSGDAILTR